MKDRGKSGLSTGMPRTSRRPGRFAAWIALLALVAVGVALAVLLFRDLDALLLVLAALLVAAAAGWIALTRRGAARGLGLLCAAAALAGGVVALVVRDAWDELIVLGAAITVFAVATRYALTRARASAGPSTSPDRRPHRRFAKAVLIMNPKSGGGKVETFDLPSEARRRGIEPVLLEPGDDLRELASRAVRSADVVGMAGGDGSQALVAEAAMERDIAYVCVPAGTRNHLALDLGLDRDDVVSALDGFTDGIERTIDLAFVNDRIFVNNVSLGIYAEIVQSEAYRDAKLQTMEQMLPALLGPRAAPFDLRFSGPDADGQTSAQLVLVSNNPYVVDRLAGMGSRPQMDTGQLGIIAVEIAGARQASELIALETLGQLRRFGGWRQWSAPRFEVVSGSPIAAGIDGEAVVMDSPLEFRIAPAALRVSMPRAASGLSPAARAPGFAESASELWEIAAARR
jgi:diacylglycerol kinase family enzyme